MVVRVTPRDSVRVLRGRAPLTTGYSAGDVPNFASVSAMEAAEVAGELFGEKVGSVGGQLYQIQVDGSAEEVNVPTFKEVKPARGSSTLPQSGQVNYYVVTGRCWVLPLTSEVTVGIQAQVTNAKWIAVPTLGASQDMCAEADIGGTAAGSSLKLTGTLDDALVIQVTGAGEGQGRPVEVRAGHIAFYCDNSSTGETSPALHFMPIDPGATITATAI